MNVNILIKNGTFNDFQTLGLLVSGFVASDFDVKIFAMSDAVYALKKDVVGTDTEIRSHFSEFASKMGHELTEGKAIPWWKLLADMKEFGEIEINVCALVADILDLEKEDFHELVDGIQGVAAFAADTDDSDFTITL